MRRILVVDDSRMQRRILSATLARDGYEVIEAGSGAEALAMLDTSRPDLILSDWMMPGMDGLSFCRAFRARPQASYVYFILLTSKAEVPDIARGLQAGADDFLTKPVNGQELRARIAAAARLLRMERALQENNRLLSATLDELRALYDSLNRDLLEAKMLQQSLVRERHRSFANGDVSLLLRPSGHVGGDLVGFFPINARRVGLFSLDVSGHGIASALMTARLAGFLSGTAPEQNVALHVSEYGIYDGRPPAEVAATLNRMVLGEITTGAYFTLLYADVDLVSGAVELVQAGHPHPLVQRADGRIEPLGEGGLPVGLLAEARYEGVSARLFPGDRLLIMSDGLTEARNATGAELGVEGLATLMTRRRGVSGPAFLQALAADLSAWSGAEPSDDLSAVLFEFRGPKENIG